MGTRKSSSSGTGKEKEETQLLLFALLFANTESETVAEWVVVRVNLQRVRFY